MYSDKELTIHSNYNSIECYVNNVLYRRFPRAPSANVQFLDDKVYISMGRQFNVFDRQFGRLYSIDMGDYSISKFYVNRFHKAFIIACKKNHSKIAIYNNKSFLQEHLFSSYADLIKDGDDIIGFDSSTIYFRDGDKYKAVNLFVDIERIYITPKNIYIHDKKRNLYLYNNGAEFIENVKEIIQYRKSIYVVRNNIIYNFISNRCLGKKDTKFLIRELAIILAEYDSYYFDCRLIRNILNAK